MNWDDVLDRMKDHGLRPIEETYMEHYGKILAAQRPEFENRNFRCTYGLMKCEGVRVEVFMFASEGHVAEFVEVIGPDPWWIVRGNLVLHFPECDPAVVEKILEALSSKSG